MFMHYLGYLFLVCLAVGGVVLLVRRFFPQWFHLARTKQGQADDYAATIDPAGQMKQAAKDAAAELKGADDALIAADKLKAKLELQITNETKTANKLRGQVAKKLRPVSEGGEGLRETDPVVVEKLKRIRDLEESVTSTHNQVIELDTEYKRLLKQANGASQKIAAAMSEAESLGVQLQFGEETARIREQMSKYNPAGVNSKMAEMDKYRQAAKDKLQGYRSQAKVAADRAAAFDEDDEDDVSPDTDPELAKILDGIKNGTTQPKTAPLS